MDDRYELRSRQGNKNAKGEKSEDENGTLSSELSEYSEDNGQQYSNNSEDNDAINKSKSKTQKKRKNQETFVERHYMNLIFAGIVFVFLFWLYMQG